LLFQKILHFLVSEILKDFASWPERCGVSKKSADTKAYVIGIGGCTNSGKTMLSRMLSNALVEEGIKVAVISQDKFYYRREEIEQVVSRANPEVIYYNYDSISAINTVEFIMEIQKQAGSNDFVIVEGNMIMEIENLRHLLHRSIFITLSRYLCEERRTGRKYDYPDMPGYLEEIVFPAYKDHLSHAYVLSRQSVDITFIDGSRINFYSESQVKNLFCTLTKNLLLIQDGELQISHAVKFVSTPKSGTTKDKNNGKEVAYLEYEVYEGMIYKELQALCDEVRRNYPAVEKIAIFHRVGKVMVGETSLILAVGAPHRKDALGGTEQALEYLKRNLPIFKKETYLDQTYSWMANNCELNYGH
uniref:Molybdopterin synthase catalytic subunit n=1 Tax=Thelazia callipaeda TaxID=103827 RepID=A0A0N5D8Y0_THECL